MSARAAFTPGRVYGRSAASPGWRRASEIDAKGVAELLTQGSQGNPCVSRSDSLEREDPRDATVVLTALYDVDDAGDTG